MSSRFKLEDLRGIALKSGTSACCVLKGEATAALSAFSDASVIAKIAGFGLRTRDKVYFGVEVGSMDFNG